MSNTYPREMIYEEYERCFILKAVTFMLTVSSFYRSANFDDLETDPVLEPYMDFINERYEKEGVDKNFLSNVIWVNQLDLLNKIQEAHGFDPLLNSSSEGRKYLIEMHEHQSKLNSLKSLIPEDVHEKILNNVWLKLRGDKRPVMKSEITDLH